MRPIHVLLTFGGQSDEHEISVVSASNILPFFNPRRYLVKPVYITQTGEWLLCDSKRFRINSNSALEIFPTIHGKPVALKIGQNTQPQLIESHSGRDIRFDVVFSTLHGSKGEDGSFQGLWEVSNIPYAGPNTTGATVGFDKDVMKRLLREAGLPICRYKSFSSASIEKINYGEIAQEFHVPFFMKPANSGSSLGVNKIYSEADFARALSSILQQDDKVIVEEYIEGNELEIYCLRCSGDVRTTVVGEIVTSSDFLTYETKYLGEKQITKFIPARIPEEVRMKVTGLAIEVYQVLEGFGLARVDFFYSKQGTVYVNEINTIPGFFALSGRRSLWSESGVSYQELVDLIITSAIQDFELKQKHRARKGG